MSAQVSDQLLRRKHVEAVTGLSRSTLYQLIQEDRFPKPVPLHGRAVAWSLNAVNQWIEKRLHEGPATQQ